MPRLEWNTTLATYHPTIDEQHKALLDAYNRVHDALGDGTDLAEIGRRLDHLRDFTTFHFRMEQGLMERAGYPRFPDHLALHEELLAQVRDVCTVIQEGKVAINPTLMGFLEAWLIEHIQEEDVRLAEFLRKQ